MKHKKSIQITAVILSLLLMSVLLTGCGGNNLSSVFDEKTIVEQAKRDIETAESGDYDAWLKRFEPTLQKSLTEDSYNSYKSLVKAKGTFKEFKKYAVAGQSKNGADYAIIVFNTSYADGSLQYTIFYDKDMKLASFSAK